MKPQPIEAAEWRQRCAGRICELDPTISREEAETIADDVRAFERTGAMEPEAAAEFVAQQMSQLEPPRFERRSKNRSDHEPFVRSILRRLTESRNAS